MFYTLYVTVILPSKKLGLSLLQRNSDVPSFCSFGRSFFVSRGQNLDGKICDQATDVSVMR